MDVEFTVGAPGSAVCHLPHKRRDRLNRGIFGVKPTIEEFPEWLLCALPPPRNYCGKKRIVRSPGIDTGRSDQSE